MIILFASLLAATAFAQDRFPTFNDTLVPTIQLTKSLEPGPEYMPDVHTLAYEEKVIPVIKALIETTDGDIWIGLEGLPANLGESELIRKLTAQTQRINLNKSWKNSIIPFKWHILVNPNALCAEINYLASRNNMFDISRPCFDMGRLYRDLGYIYLDENAPPEASAPGLQYLQALVGTKAHFFGLEQGDNYAKHLAALDYGRAEHIETLITDMDYFKNKESSVQPTDIPLIHSIEQALNDIKDEANAFANSVVVKWPSVIHKDEKEFVSQRSKDWVKSDLLRPLKGAAS